MFPIAEHVSQLTCTSTVHTPMAPRRHTARPSRFDEPTVTGRNGVPDAGLHPRLPARRTMAIRPRAVLDRPMTQAQSAARAADAGIVLRRPQLTDGQPVHALVRRCPPLDLNSSYSYFLLCSHHADTCVVAQRGEATVGFLSAYRLPQAPHTLFVWQVAVDASTRGQGLAGRMLEELLAGPSCAGVHYVETTVSPSNLASRRVFVRFAAQRQAAWQEEVFLSRAHFGSEAHEEEILLRIGPFTPSPT